MQFKNFHTDGDLTVAPASQVDRLSGRPSQPAWKTSAVATTTVALSMLAFNIAAFVPAGATPAAKPAVKKAPAQVAQAAKPYLPKHRSIWALRWAAAHPAQEAIFQAQLERRWAARHHLRLAGLAKPMPATHAWAVPAAKRVVAKHVAAKPVSHAPIKAAVVKHAPAKVAKIAHAPIKVAAIKRMPARVAAVKIAPARHAAVKVAKAVPAIRKPAPKTVSLARHIVPVAAHAAIAAAAVKHTAAAPAKTAKAPAAKAQPIKVASAPIKKAPKSEPAKVAAKVVPAHRPVAVAAIKAQPAKVASVRPASKASAGKVRLVKAHIAKIAAAPAPALIRASAIKAVAAAVRQPSVKLAALPAKAAIAEPTVGQARQNHAAATSLQPSDTVTLDFVSADINDVLKALAVQTGTNIVSSADVKGTVTVSLADVSLEQALDMVARLSGYEYAKVGNTYVVGTASGIQALTGSAGSTAQQSTEVVTFTYANPDDVLAVLKQRFPTMDISKGTSISGEKAGAGTKALILTGDPSYISQAKDLVVQLDQSMGANVASESTVAYRVKYASIGDLINILASLDPSLVVTPGPGQGFTAKAPSAAASASSSSGSSAGASGSGGSSPSGSSSGGGATGSSQSAATGPSMLLLTGTDADIARAQQILAQVDVQPKQLLFDTKVVEMSNDAERQLGLTYDFSGAKTRIGEETDNIADGQPTLGDNSENGRILSFGTFGRTAISDLVTVQLNALETNGKAKLLADPDISAIDGQPAQVFIGDEINYVSSITTSTTGENVTTATVQVGVIFRVTGRVDNDGYITLNIHPEVSSIAGWVTVPGGGQLPNVSTRYADTTIRVKDGDTIAIGGLIQQNDIENIQKVPILGDLPFFGQLFRYNDHSKQTDQVVFFLKTSIMNQS